MAIKKIPVTVISGFLGSGKTTLVNHLLKNQDAVRIGVVVNEFGEVGIDGDLIVADETPVIEISNGCICCTVRTDLVASVKQILARAGTRLDRLVIEASGLADPAPVLQTFLADADLLQQVELESMVTMIDAHHIRDQLGDEIVREQIAFADLILLNKVDLVAPQESERLKRELAAVNPTAEIRLVRNAAVAIDALFGEKRFSLPNLLAIEPDLLDEGEHDHEHDASISSCSVVTQSPLDATRFNRWINRLVQAEGAQLMRMKGVLNFESEARRFHFHSVHMLLDATPGRRWKIDETRASKFVFIGRNLDEAALRDGFLDCLQ
jgi:G3E family GTPase